MIRKRQLVYPLPIGYICGSLLLTAAITVAAWLNREDLNLYVFKYDSDKYMDFYNTLFWSRLSGAFTNWGSVTSPALLSLLRLVGKLLDLESIGAYEMRTRYEFISPVLIAATSLMIALNIQIPKHGIEPHGLNLINVTLAIQLMFFPPLIFLYDRQNLLFVAILMYLLFLMALGFVGSKKKVGGILDIQDLLYLCLFLSSLVKIYLATAVAIGILTTQRGRKMVVFGVGMVSVFMILNVLPMNGLIYDGGIDRWIANVVKFPSSNGEITQLYIDSTLQSVASSDLVRIYTSLPKIFVALNHETFSLEKGPGYMYDWLMVAASLERFFVYLISGVFIAYLILWVTNRARCGFSNSSDRLYVVFQLSLMPVLILQFLTPSLGLYSLSFLIPYIIAYIKYTQRTEVNIRIKLSKILNISYLIAIVQVVSAVGIFTIDLTMQSMWIRILASCGYLLLFVKTSIVFDKEEIEKLYSSCIQNARSQD